MAGGPPEAEYGANGAPWRPPPALGRRGAPANQVQPDTGKMLNVKVVLGSCGAPANQVQPCGASMGGGMGGAEGRRG